MKLLDKIKDLFMDEITEDEEIDLLEEEKEEYKEPKYELPKVMRETIKEEEKVELKVKPEEFVKNEVNTNGVVRQPQKEQEPPKKFNFPIDFGDELPSRNNKNYSNQNILKIEKEKEREKEATKKVAELYPKKEEIRVKPKFKATPVISPVYGILDKNYKKEEVKEKPEENFEMKRPSKKVDFETVRKKAFGNLVDDIKDNLICENCELYKEVKKISSLKEDDLLYDMTVDPKDKEVTIEKAYDNYEEFGVAYEPQTTKVNSTEEQDKSDLDKIINDSNENIENSSSQVDLNKKELPDDKEETKEEKIPTRSKKDTEKDTKVDDDFFELIDSMYKERSDE